MKDKIDKILSERQNTHGAFKDNCDTMGGLLKVMMDAGLMEKDVEIQVTLINVAGKITRMLNGDASFPDHRHDIIGYMELLDKLLDEKNR